MHLTAKVIQFDRNKKMNSAQEFASGVNSIVDYLDDFTERCQALTKGLKDDIVYLKSL